jgi:regulator of sirC expression with transglutaminase-like and TPR domain
MSASPDTVDGRATPIVYDLSNAKTKAYSTTPLDSIAANRWALAAGDVNGSGTIVYNGADGIQPSNDRGQIYIRVGGGNVNVTVTGYYNEDANLSGTVVYNGADGSYPTNDRGMIYHSIGGGNVNVVRSNQVP